MEQQSQSAAKYAFYYMLSLVSLIFMSLSTGMIIFQIINKKIVDSLGVYSGMFSSGSLKFAISAIIISAPIYFVTTWVINKNLFDGKLEKESQVRKWLTYFILFVSSVVMIGWLIGTIYNFLDGELTKKFILKAVTALAISASVFSYYFYDIKRDQVVGAKNKVIMTYFWVSLVVVIAALVGSFFFVESPSETRDKKYDAAILNKFEMIDNGINTYFDQMKKLPANLDELVTKTQFVTAKDIVDPTTNKKIEYKLKGKTKYELCADFKTANKDMNDQDYEWINNRWPHEKGYQCIPREVLNVKDAAAETPAMVEKANLKSAPMK